MTKSNGKFIITGEHSVVYGELAVVCELNKSIKVELFHTNGAPKLSAYQKHIFEVFSKKFGVNFPKLSVRVKSQIPQKSGLGSSAALAHALLLALAKQINVRIPKHELYDLVLECEAFIHVKPSGIDPYAVVYGKTHSFKKNKHTSELRVEQLDLLKKYKFLLVNSGPAQESTGEMVLNVLDLVKKDPRARRAIKTIGIISKRIKDQLLNGTFDGVLLEKNQEQLEILDVVGNTAKKMINKFKQNGISAKVTGAGGVKTGSGWILAFDHDLDKVQKFCINKGWETINVEVK